MDTDYNRRGKTLRGGYLGIECTRVMRVVEFLEDHEVPNHEYLTGKLRGTVFGRLLSPQVKSKLYAICEKYLRNLNAPEYVTLADTGN